MHRSRATALVVVHGHDVVRIRHFNLFRIRRLPAAIAPLVDDRHAVQPEAHAVVGLHLEEIAAAWDEQLTQPAHREILAGDAASRPALAPIEVHGGIVALERRRAGEIAVVEVGAAPRAGMIRIGRRPIIRLPPHADGRLLGVVEVIHAQVVVAAAQRRAAVCHHGTLRLPPVNDRQAIDIHADAVIAGRMETIAAGRQRDGARPARRKAIGGDAGIG